MKLFPTVSYTAFRLFTPRQGAAEGQDVRLLGSHFGGVEGFDVLSKMVEKMRRSGMPEGNEEELVSGVLALKFSLVLVGGGATPAVGAPRS
jgi:hypothetical protein